MAQRNDEPVELAATIEGEGRPLVLLHGTASSSAMWQPMLAVLGAERRTIAIDLRGHGRSGPWRAGERPSLAAEAASVAARVAGFGGAFDLVGHSYGGAVALRLAMTMPRRISSLTLIEPAAFQILRDRDGVDRELLARIAAIAEGIHHGVPSTEAAVARFVDYWNGAGFWATLRADRRRALVDLAPTISANFQAILSDPLRMPDCTALDLPFLLLAGERTTRLARRVVSLLGMAAPFARLRLVEGAGHMVPRTHPITVLQAIRAHLARVAAGPAPARRRIAA